MARRWNSMGVLSSRSGRRSAREAHVPHDCHVAPRPLARPLGPAYKHHMQGMRNDTGHGRVHTHYPLTQVRAGGSSTTERASHDARSERDVVCDCEQLCRFHAVAVSCCGGMLHLWWCVLDTCVGGRPRVAHTTDTKVSFLARRPRVRGIVVLDQSMSASISSHAGDLPR